MFVVMAGTMVYAAPHYMGSHCTFFPDAGIGLVDIRKDLTTADSISMMSNCFFESIGACYHGFRIVSSDK